MNAEADSLSPLTDPDNLDVVGERNDGGVDMLVATAGPLDASDETCRRLQEKLSAYLYAATHPNFAKVYPAGRDGRVRIFVSDSHTISERARVVVEIFSREALARDVEVHIGSPVA
jgi:hypothetical protein